MCGRFAYTLTWPEVVKLYRLPLDTHARDIQQRHSVCPPTTIDTVIGRAPRALVPMRWGIIPSWWSKPLKDMKVTTFNVRVETIREKPMSRRAFQHTRCLIPVSGYYEWHDGPDGNQTTSPDVTAHLSLLRVSGTNGATDKRARRSGHAQ